MFRKTRFGTAVENVAPIFIFSGKITRIWANPMDFRWFWRSKLGGRPLEYEINYKIDELSIYLVLMNVITLVMPYIRAMGP